MLKRRLQITLFILLAAWFQAKAQVEPMAIDVHLIELSVSKVSENLYAGKFEVTNAFYQTYLQDIASMEMVIEQRLSRIDSSEWIHPPDFHYQHLYIGYQSGPAYKDYPVVNVSFDGAREFCNWLTDFYNAMPNRKFRRVIFRLPTEQEWMQAAKGGHDSAIYANGDVLKDEKGDFLYNYKISEGLASIPNTKAIPPNSPMILPSNSNTFNDYGIYNMSGNVAELVSDFGITKGGSFMDAFPDLQIKASGDYRHPMPTIGFRYFMFLIEE